ncbi:MAG TPA: hypothetical protein VHM19_03920 [Polyangiales bacterium]|jgi:hypothetical protein|nr:hypothetical protein [Polyangiales bacterium]
MDPTPTPTSPTSNEEDSTSKKLLKGCGCTTAVVVLAGGILVIGNFDSGSWASALGAVVISVLVFNLSGVNGFWEK